MAGQEDLPPTGGPSPLRRLAAAAGRLGNRPSGGASSDVAGFFLAALFWGWIALPFLRSGPTGVRDMLRAKFLNKGPGGEALP